ncbi:MAG: HD-GYP domain-containing protein [Selenomonadaceae bacterium]|nr:HD-GYP domain-containing protein [Selenomonadaceae bacterium]
MIELQIKNLKPGMVIAQSVYNSSGANYLTRGQRLTQGYIDRLREMGLQDMHVSALATDSNCMPPEDVLQESTRAMAVKRVYDVFQQVSKDGTFDVNPLERASISVLNDITERRGNLVQLTDIRVHDMYTFAHSVNVAMLSALLGVLCGLSKAELSELTLGAMLHDLGKLSVSGDILNKPDRLTDEEFAIIKKHPAHGRKLIMDMKIPNAARLSIVAHQHHEKMNGKGYPEGKAGKEIHKYGRIAAIADVYDALTSRRPYKKGYSPELAYNIMKNCSPGHFDEELLQLFFTNVAIYPVGTVLNTSLGYGIVRQVEFGKTDRPIVCIFADKNLRRIPTPYDVDFSAAPEEKISNVINDKELYHFIFQMNFDPSVLIG